MLLQEIINHKSIETLQKWSNYKGTNLVNTRNRTEVSSITFLFEKLQIQAKNPLVGKFSRHILVKIILRFKKKIFTYRLKQCPDVPETTKKT